MSTQSEKLSDEALAAFADEHATEHLPAKTLGALADEWWEIKQQRLAADRTAAKLKAREDMLQSAIIMQCRLQEITGVGGQVVRVGVWKDEVPTVKDWDKFYTHIKKTGDFDLLERRPSKAAVKLRWEDGKVVPGVEKFPVYKLSKQGVK